MFIPLRAESDPLVFSLEWVEEPTFYQCSFSGMSKWKPQPTQISSLKNFTIGEKDISVIFHWSQSFREIQIDHKKCFPAFPVILQAAYATGSIVNAWMPVIELANWKAKQFPPPHRATAEDFWFLFPRPIVRWRFSARVSDLRGVAGSANTCTWFNNCQRGSSFYIYKK